MYLDLDPPFVANDFGTFSLLRWPRTTPGTAISASGAESKERRRPRGLLAGLAGLSPTWDEGSSSHKEVTLENKNVD